MENARAVSFAVLDRGAGQHYMFRYDLAKAGRRADLREETRGKSDGY